MRKVSGHDLKNLPYVPKVCWSDDNTMIVFSSFLKYFFNSVVLCHIEQEKSFTQAEDFFVQEPAIKLYNRQIQQRDSKEWQR